MLTIVATVLVVAATVALGLWIDRRLGVKPAQLAEGATERPVERAADQVRAGETAAAAIRAKPAQLDRLRATSRCAHCRAELRADDDEAIRYDDRRLVLLHLTCPACGRNRSLYVEPIT